MIIGYARISTRDQNTNRQLDWLKEAGCEKIFIDQLTGAKAERKELQAMYEMLRSGDMVVITELSRFARSVKDIIHLTGRLEEMGVNLKCLKQEWLDTSTPQGRYFFYMTAAYDEMMRELIVENTREGLKAARARGRQGGRPKASEKAVKMAIKMYDSKEYTITEITKAAGISQGTLYKNINKRKK